MKKIIYYLIAYTLILSNISVTMALEKNDNSNGYTYEDLVDENEIIEADKKARNVEVEVDTKDINQDNDVSVCSTTTGTYPSRKGVILYTNSKYKGIIKTGHAAMVYSDKAVYEALSKGVVKGKNNWNSKKRKDIGDVWAMSVKGTSAAQDAKAAEYCKKQLGKPYNYAFASINKRDSFYCSHLVYAAYKDTCYVDLNTSKFDGSLSSKAIHPSELRDGPKTKVIYKYIK